MNVESFVFYESFYNSLRRLDDQTRLMIYDAICLYALHHTIPEGLEDNVVAISIFDGMRAQLDANYKRRMGGAKGGRPAKTQSAETEDTVVKNHRLSTPKTIGYANTKPNVNVNVNGNEHVNVNEKSIKRFTPPSLEEVTSYCSERKNQVDPQRFIDFYASKGWMVGSNKMKDWKAAVRNWEARDSQRHQETDDLPFYDSSGNPETDETRLNEILSRRAS